MLSNFSWVIERKLAGMARPNPTDETARELKALGVGAVVTLALTALPERLSSQFIYAHVPIPDFCAPTLEQVQSYVAFVDECLANGNAVVTHCTAGYGRTGTMLACYFVRRGLTAEEAIGRVTSLRPGSIETREQEQSIRDYASHLARRDGE